MRILESEDLAIEIFHLVGMLVDSKSFKKTFTDVENEAHAKKMNGLHLYDPNTNEYFKFNREG